MTATWSVPMLVLGLVAIGPTGGGRPAQQTSGSGAARPGAGARPGFHHLHMNSPNPSAVIDELMAVYPSSRRVNETGVPGIRSANGVVILFTKVDHPAPAPGPDRVSGAAPQTAFWHHVWASPDARRALARLRERVREFDAVRLIPQYTGPEGRTVEFSSDTFAGFLTTSEVEAARTRGATPPHKGGYFNWYGPDGVVMETADGGPEAYRIVGMFQDQPYCAVLWYRTHLNASDVPVGAARAARTTEAPPIAAATCAVTRGREVSWPSTYRRGHYRIPSAQSVFFDDVQLRWYMNQEERPLAPTRGQLLDHLALSVADLDVWAAKLQAEGVRLLESPYKLGETRAFMVEGPSREAIELVEVR